MGLLQNEIFEAHFLFRRRRSWIGVQDLGRQAEEIIKKVHLATGSKFKNNNPF